jgi:hypothetical protein
MPTLSDNFSIPISSLLSSISSITSLSSITFIIVITKFSISLSRFDPLPSFFINSIFSLLLDIFSIVVIVIVWSYSQFVTFGSFFSIVLLVYFYVYEYILNELLLSLYIVMIIVRVILIIHHKISKNLSFVIDIFHLIFDVMMNLFVFDLFTIQLYFPTHTYISVSVYIVADGESTQKIITLSIYS